MRVLIVDDQLEYCEKHKEEINNWGYDADFVLTRTEALKFIENVSPPVNLVLMDYKLADDEPNGIEVIREIKKKHKDIECILYTFWDDSDIGRKALLEAGAYRYVEKSDFKLWKRYLEEVDELLKLRASAKLTGEVGVNLLDMIDSMPVEVSILDRDYNILFVNTTLMEKHLNPFDETDDIKQNRAVLIGKNCYDIFPMFKDMMKKCDNCPITKVLESKKPFQRKTYEDLEGHHFSTDRNKARYPVSEYAAPLKFDENGEVSLILHVVEDITRVHYLKLFAQQTQGIVEESHLVNTLFKNIRSMDYARARLFYLEDGGLVGVKCIGEHGLLPDKKFEELRIPIPNSTLKNEIDKFRIPRKFNNENKYFFQHSGILDDDILKDWIACPLIISAKTIGVLEIDNKGNDKDIGEKSNNDLDNKDLEVLADLARFFAQALSNIRRNKEIEKTNIILDGIIESVQDGVIVLDEKGYRIKINRATEKMLKVSKEQLIYKNIREKSYYWDENEGNKILGMLEKGPIRGYITALKDIAGNRVDISHNISYLYDSDKKRWEPLVFLETLDRKNPWKK